MDNQAVLVPTYMLKFSCIGSDCEDTCCNGWRVDIDKATYKKYKKMDDAELLPILNQSMKRNRFNPSDHRYAYIELTENGCPFLTEEKLCGIQQKHGEKFLSHTCQSYPRVENMINDVIERSLTVSCPEAARLVLLDPQGIVFTEIAEHGQHKQKVSKFLNTNQTEDAIEKLFWELRIFTIQLLQNRNYPLSDRLVILGLFFKKVQTLIDENKTNDLMQAIALYMNEVETGSISTALPSTPKLIEIQMKLLKQISDVRIQMGIASLRYLECHDEFLEGLGYKADDRSDESVGLCYQQAYEMYYEPFMKNHEYILENYLVNHVFRTAFPLRENQSVYHEFVRLAAQYSLLKIHLIGMAGYHKESFHTDHVVKLVQSFAKVVEHNSKFLDIVVNNLEENGFDTMAYMAILIRN